MLELLKSEMYLDSNGNKIDFENAVGTSGLIGLLFTASWWPGCKPFKSQLQEIYKECNKDTRQLQVITVSADRDENGFDASRAGTPWVAFPFDATKVKALVDAATGMSGSSFPG